MNHDDDDVDVKCNVRMCTRARYAVHVPCGHERTSRRGRRLQLTAAARARVAGTTNEGAGRDVRASPPPPVARSRRAGCMSHSTLYALSIARYQNWIIFSYAQMSEFNLRAE